MRALFLTLAVSLFGCQPPRQHEAYPVATAADLILDPANHPHGYGSTSCFTCHQAQNIHLVDRLGIPSFGLAKQEVEQAGLASCAGCHGRNGAQP